MANAFGGSFTALYVKTSHADSMSEEDKKRLLEHIALAEKLRGYGLKVQLYGERKKFKQKMSYADKLGVPYAVLLGEDEIAAGKCSVKNMRSGEQVILSPDEAASHIRSGLEAQNGNLILEK